MENQLTAFGQRAVRFQKPIITPALMSPENVPVPV
jgi:hypothetical protein